MVHSVLLHVVLSDLVIDYRLYVREYGSPCAVGHSGPEAGQIAVLFAGAAGLLADFFLCSVGSVDDGIYAAHQQQELYKYLKYELEMRRCATVLNTSPQLTQVLENFGIKTTGILQAATSADAVIVYSQFLIARSGGIVVSQRDGLMVYPSIKGLAKHIIVLSSSRNVLPDLNDLCNATVITSKEKNRAEEYDFDFDMAEIIHPTQVEDEAVSANSPKITLLLVEER